MLNTKTTRVAAVAAGLSLTGAALFSAGMAIATNDESGVGGEVVEPATTITGDLKAFPILRKAQGKTPDSVTAKLLSGPSRSGQNIALARSVASPDGPVWIAPGRNKICINMPDPVDGLGVVCSEASVAKRQGAIGIMVDPKAPNVKKVSLVLPDGAKANVTNQDGTTSPLQPVDGVVNQAFDQAKTITVTGPNGETKVYDLPGPIPVHPTPEEKALAAAEAASTK